jgi:hypothetical protein
MRADADFFCQPLNSPNERNEVSWRIFSLLHIYIFMLCFWLGTEIANVTCVENKRQTEKEGQFRRATVILAHIQEFR